MKNNPNSNNNNKVVAEIALQNNKQNFPASEKAIKAANAPNKRSLPNSSTENLVQCAR